MIFEDEEDLIFKILELFKGHSTTEQKIKIKQYLEHVYNEGYTNYMKNNTICIDKNIDSL